MPKLQSKTYSKGAKTQLKLSTFVGVSVETMSKNHTMDSSVTNPAMSILSQQKNLQNQLQLQSLQQQQALQQKTKSFNSTRSQDTASRVAIGGATSSANRRNSIHRDPRDPLTVQIPTSSNPTDILAGRFAAWRSITRLLIIYLKEVAAVHEEVVRHQVRLQHLISFPFNMQGLNGELYQPFSQQTNSSLQDEVKALSQFFLPLGNGSIQDLPTTLFQFHLASAQMAGNISKELTSTTIPRLDELQRDLLVKIKEIRGLQSDFKNTVNREQLQTKQELQGYQNALDVCKSNPSGLQPRHDPYLLKLSLDKQIKKQLTEENFLHELYLNLQSSGKELEKVVVIEIQALLTIAAKLLGQEAQLVFDILITKLDSGFITKDATFEWDNFISTDSNFVDPNLPMRHTTDIKFEGQTSTLSTRVRSGYLERRSKFLKSFSKGWYVLTPMFIHEFKSSDRKKDPYPIMSLSLDDVQVAEFSKKEGDGSSWHKFVLHAKQNGIIHRGHNWVFRAESYDAMMLWYNDIKTLASVKPRERALILAERRKREQTVKPGSGRSSILSKKGDVMLSIPQQGKVLPNSSSLAGSEGVLDSQGVITLPQQRQQPPYPTFNASTPRTHNNNNINNNNTNSMLLPDNSNTTVSSDVDFSTISDTHHNLQKTATTEDSLITPPDLYDRLNDQQKQAFKRYSIDTDRNGDRTLDGRTSIDKMFD